MNYVSRSPQVPAYLQLRLLSQSLSAKRNYKVIQAEAQQIAGQLGVPAEFYFLVQLLETFDISKEKTNAAPSQKQTLITTWIQTASLKSHFIDYFSQVIEVAVQSTQSSNPSNAAEYVNELSNCLKLSLSTQLILFLSLSLSPTIAIQKDGIKMLKKKLHDYCQNGKPQNFPQYLIHKCTGIKCNLISTKKNIIQEMDMEVKFFLESVIGSRTTDMKPLFENGKIKQKVKWADITSIDNFEIKTINRYIKPVDLLKDIGPSCCSGTTNQLSILFADFLPLTEDDILQCLLYMSTNVQTLEDKQTRQVNNLYYVANGINDWQSLLQEDQVEHKIQLTWNIDTFATFCHEKHPNLNWSSVIEKIDRPNLEFSEQKSWVNFMTNIARIKRLYPFQFPSNLLFKKWYYKGSQVQFLNHMVHVGKPELVFWNDFPKRWVEPNFRQVANLLQFWACIDFVQLLVELSEWYIVEIRELFEIPLRNNADLLILSLSQIQPTCGGALIDELFTTLFPNYVTQHANTISVLEQLWKYNQYLVISGICELYRKELTKKDSSCLNLSRVLDITQSITTTQQQTSSLLEMARCGDHNFSVPLGILAGKREFLNFDRWLQDRIKVGQQSFVQTLLSYMEENVLIPIREQQSKTGLGPGQLNQLTVPILDGILEKAQLKLEMITIIFEQLLSQTEKLGQKIKQKTQKIYKEVVQVFPQLAGPPNPKANQDVERQTDSLFNQFYSEQVSVESLLGLLVQWKQFGNIQDKEVYACVITNLYNEYQFHSKYPQKELQMTGQLFGGVIEKNLVEGKTLQIGLQIINVSLKNNNIRFEFGLKALEMIQNRVWEWQWFAEQLLCEGDILPEKHPQLLEKIYESCINHGIHLNVPQVRLDKIRSKPLIPQVQQQLQVPSFPIQVNNPQQQQNQAQIQNQNQNLNQNQLIHPQPQGHRSQQSVTPPPMHTQQMMQQQAHTPQPNLKKQESQSVQISFKEVLSMEFEEPDRKFQDDPIKKKINFILNNTSTENIGDKAEELKVLIANADVQNWFIKLFTLVRIPKSNCQQYQVHNFFSLLQKINKLPLFRKISKELSLALTLLIEQNKQNLALEDRAVLKNMGSFLGQLTLYRNKPVLTKYFDYRKLLAQSQYTILAIVKICEWSKNNEIFRQENPWMKNLLEALDKENETCNTMTRYEISLLFQALDYKSDPNQARKTQSQPVQPSQSPIQQSQQFNIQNLVSYVTVDEKSLTMTGKSTNLRTLIATAVDKAIQDIIPPVISRSVTIALITTRELALKDFAYEPNEKTLLRGTNLMVQSLSGSLALVTCREPLKMSIQGHMKTLLQDVKELDQQQKEQIIQVASLENLDLGCALIKKAVIEKALEDVNADKVIMDELDKRKNYREQHLRLELDQSQLLPEPLQPHPDGLTDQELRIYEDFAKITSKKPAQSQPNIQKQIAQIFQEITQDQSFSQTENILSQNLSDLSKAPEIQSPMIAQDIAFRIIDTLLFKNLPLEKILQLLEQMETIMNIIIATLNTKWWQFIQQFSGNNIEKFDESPRWWIAIYGMMRKKYLIWAEVETLLIYLLNSKETQSIANGSAQLIKQVIVTEKSEFNIQISQCKSIITNLKKIHEKQPNNQINKLFLDIYQNYLIQQQQSQQMNPQSQPQTQNMTSPINIIQQIPQSQNILSQLQSQPSQPPIIGDSNMDNKQQILQFYKSIDQQSLKLAEDKLNEWSRLLTESEMKDYIKKLEDDNILKSDENIVKFFAYIIEICVNRALMKSEQQQESVNCIDSLDYSQIDQLSKLIILILRSIINFDRNVILKQILDATLMVITKFHENHKVQFNQRPINKLLFNLLFEIKRPIFKFLDEEIKAQFLVFTNFLVKCEPNLYPGFSFSWLELISNRFFISTMLSNQSGYKPYSQLIISLLVFLREIISEQTLKQDSVMTFYKGCLRVFLLLIHDFWQFSCEYALTFADEIPFNQLQILNIFLAAYPKNKVYPSPEETQNITLLEDSTQTPIMEHPSLLDNELHAQIQEEILGCFALKTDEDFKNLIHKLFEYNETLKQRIPLKISSFFIILPSVVNKFHKTEAEAYQMIIVKNYYSISIFIIENIKNFKFPFEEFDIQSDLEPYSLPQYDHSLLYQLCVPLILRRKQSINLIVAISCIMLKSHCREAIVLGIEVLVQRSSKRRQISSSKLQTLQKITFCLEKYLSSLDNTNDQQNFRFQQI